MRIQIIYTVEMKNSPDVNLVGIYKNINSEQAQKDLQNAISEDYDDDEIGDWRQTHIESAEIPDTATGPVHVAIVTKWIESVFSKVVATDPDPAVITRALLEAFADAKKDLHHIEYEDVDQQTGAFYIADDTIMEDNYGFHFEATVL